MSAKKIRVALIGCGRVAGHHARSIAQVEGLELAGVCDLVEEKARDYGKQFAVPYFTNYHEMFEKAGPIDVTAIVTPSGMHFEHAMDILSRYGTHLIVEKPTFLKTSQAVKLFEAAARAGRHVFPVFQNRFNKAVQRVKKALDSGELGKLQILAVRVRWCRPQRYYDLSDWRGTYAQDGGALTNQGVHHVDLIRFLGGEVSSVSSRMKTLGADIEVEDSVMAHFGFKTGAIGNLEVTTAARPLDFEASISIVGSEGLAQIGGIAVNELQVFTPSPGECPGHSEDFSGCVYGEGHKVIYKGIRDLFFDKKPYVIPREDCLETLKLLHAFYVSDEKGTDVQPSLEAESARLGRPDEKLADLYRTPAPLKRKLDHAG